MDYKEIVINIQTNMREDIIGIMLMMGFESFNETDEALHAFIPVNRWSVEYYKRIEKVLLDYKNSGVIQSYDMRVEDIADRNWQEDWEKSVKPVRIGRKIYVRASWHKSPESGDMLDVIIDPKMGFGTGHHETTVMMAELLEKKLSPGMSVLDAGTGSGILAIIASKMQASYVAAFDNDKDAFENAIENCKKNDVTDVIDLYFGELNDLSPFRVKEFDLILANIEKNVILKMFRDFQTCLKPGGCLVLSGLLKEDELQIIEYCSILGMNHVESTCRSSETSDEWLAMVIEK